MNTVCPVHRLLSGAVRSFSTCARSRLVDNLSVVGACNEVGQPRPGTRDAPDILRDLGIVDYIRRSGYSVTDNGNVVDDQSLCGEVRGVKNPLAVGSFCHALSEKISSQTDKFHLTLGGDHSLALGTLHGHALTRPNIKVLWVDAHADINTCRTSPSGNLHGMPLGILMEGLEGHFDGIPGLDWVEKRLSPKDLVYVGLRDIDDGEIEIMKNLGIKWYDNREVQSRGIQAVTEEALSLLKPSAEQPLHLSFDIDALDPIFAPSTGTRAPYGLTREEGLHVCHEAARTGALGAMDIVEVNPSMGSKLDVLKTARMAFDMVGAGLGLTRAEIDEAQEEFEAVIPPVTANYGATYRVERDMGRRGGKSVPKRAQPQSDSLYHMPQSEKQSSN